MSTKHIRDPQVLQWLKEAGTAASDWIVQNGKFAHEVAKAIRLDEPRLLEIIQGTNTFVPLRDGEALARLYWLSGGIEAINPTLIPIEVQNPTSSSPIRIPRALPKERLEELRDEVPASPPQPTPRGDDVKADNSIDAKEGEESLALARSASEAMQAFCKEKHIFPPSELARRAGMPPHIWYSVGNGRGYTNKRWYAELFMETGLPQVDPRHMPPPKRVYDRRHKSFTEGSRSMTPDEWEEFLKTQPPERKRRHIELVAEHAANVSVPLPAEQETTTTSMGGLLEQLLLAGLRHVVQEVGTPIQLELEQLRTQNAELATAVGELTDQVGVLVELLKKRPDTPSQSEAQSVDRLANATHDMTRALILQVVNTSPAQRDRLIERHAEELGQLSRILTAALNPRGRRDEALSLFKQFGGERR